MTPAEFFVIHFGRFWRFTYFDECSFGILLWMFDLIYSTIFSDISWLTVKALTLPVIYISNRCLTWHQRKPSFHLDKLPRIVIFLIESDKWKCPICLKFDCVNNFLGRVSGYHPIFAATSSLLVTMIFFCSAFSLQIIHGCRAASIGRLSPLGRVFSFLLRPDHISTTVCFFLCHILETARPILFTGTQLSALLLTTAGYPSQHC